MSTNRSVPIENASDTWFHRWIFYIAAGFLFAAALLRSLIIYQGSPDLAWILGLLLAWLLLLAGDSLLFPRLPKFCLFLIALQAALALLLLLRTGTDYFSILFAVLGMQAMQQFPPRIGAVFIGVSAVLIFLVLIGPVGAFQALAMAVAVSAVSVFAGGFVLAARRAGTVQEQNRLLAGELRQANRRLEDFARQQEQLAASRERQHLARELHDSITQTVFSMNLTTQSAILLLDGDKPGAAVQLERLSQLAGSALAEMQMLISQLAPERPAPGGLDAALRQHLADRLRLENLSVDLQVEGAGRLEPAEEQGLLRIAREALNNIVKHAGVERATIRLNLVGQPWLEIEDRGAGFDPQSAAGRGRLGLAGMCERAAEIGWTLRVDSSPGTGTRIRVEKDPEGVRQA